MLLLCCHSNLAVIPQQCSTYNNMKTNNVRPVLFFYTYRSRRNSFPNPRMMQFIFTLFIYFSFFGSHLPTEAAGFALLFSCLFFLFTLILIYKCFCITGWDWCGLVIFEDFRSICVAQLYLMFLIQHESNSIRG